MPHMVSAAAYINYYIDNTTLLENGACPSSYPTYSRACSRGFIFSPYTPRATVPQPAARHQCVRYGLRTPPPMEGPLVGPGAVHTAGQCARGGAHVSH